jgi:hypothetical protein
VEAANLQTWEAEACQHAEEAEKMASDLSERVRKDGEEAAQVMRESDELRQQDAEACQQILNLQDELKKEKGLKLAAQEKVTALEKKARQDATVAEWLHKERDDSCQTEMRLCSERDGARRERDSAQQGVSSLQSDLKREGAHKLEAKGVSTRLIRDLAQSQKELTLVKEAL